MTNFFGPPLPPDQIFEKVLVIASRKDMTSGGVKTPWPPRNYGKVRQTFFLWALSTKHWSYTQIIIKVSNHCFLQILMIFMYLLSHFKVFLLRLLSTPSTWQVRSAPLVCLTFNCSCNVITRHRWTALVMFSPNPNVCSVCFNRFDKLMIMMKIQDGIIKLITFSILVIL